MSFTKDRSVYHFHRVNNVHEYYTTADVSGKVRKLLRTRTGESQPQYKMLIAGHENATTPMTGTFHELLVYPGDAWFITKNPNDSSDKKEYRQGCSGDLAGIKISMPSKPDVSVSTAYNRCLIKHLKHVRSVQVAYSAPTFLGELRESLHMLRHPAEAFRRGLGEYVSRVGILRKRKPKHWKKDLAGTWLEYAFGWAPLISDVNNAYKAYQDLYHPASQGEMTWVRDVGVEEVAFPAECAFEYPANVGYVSNLGRGFNSYTYKQVAVVVLRSMVYRQVNADSTFSKKAQRFGFDPLEFVPTAWELLPWSFLVDYFTNIGDVLQASVVDKSTIKFTNETDIVFHKKEYCTGYEEKACRQSYPGFLRGGGNAALAKLTYRNVNRIKAVSLGWPMLSLELPGKPAQFCNMAALWTQVNNGIFPQRNRRAMSKGLQKNMGNPNQAARKSSDGTWTTF